jgi:hypothetical protein
MDFLIDPPQSGIGTKIASTVSLRTKAEPQFRHASGRPD